MHTCASEIAEDISVLSVLQINGAHQVYTQAHSIRVLELHGAWLYTAAHAAATQIAPTRARETSSAPGHFLSMTSLQHDTVAHVLMLST